MESYEKEEVLAEELHKIIDRFVQEYQITYSQVIGVLEVIKSELVHEGFLEEDDD